MSREELIGFARARLLALRHIEGAFRYRNRYVKKEPVPLPRPTGGAARPQLAQVLQEFLAIEHHAQRESRLLHYSHPVERRVASGESILVEAVAPVDGDGWRFRYRFEEAGLDPALALAQMSPKEGDWMVLSPSETTRPWEILHGRVARIHELGEREMTVDFIEGMHRGGRFRYAHDSSIVPIPGHRYVLDPMADDLVAERCLEACRHADGNVFLAWAEAGGAAVRRRRVPVEDRDAVERFVEALERSARILTPTAKQRQVIAGHLRERILLVQGPPGTGKTHTIAWAILARAYAAARAERSFHVLVSAMTHTAVEVVLESLRGKLGQLERDPSAREVVGFLRGMQLYKERPQHDRALPAGVRPLPRDGLDQALSDRLVVIGAVPGGVHRLLRGNSRTTDWTRQCFDLLVIDEASQVHLPAAILAGAPLRPEGQALVVGDHRQMTPILVHDWEREPRRTTQDTQVYRSSFEFLLGAGFPAVRLDESFRLHAMHADFLERHVYREDRVGFHSKRSHLLRRAPGLQGHVRAALEPEYPVVVVEHTESASLKLNETEIDIVEPIVRAAVEQLRLDGQDGIGIVVPHRAQRAALQRRFPELAEAGAIDTVERFQGGERDLIIVSATASDPQFVLAEARFLLNPNRLNVAFSRPRKKLIVVGSTTIFRLMPPDMETFEDALLWKRLRYEFSAEVLWEGEIHGAEVRVSGRRAERRTTRRSAGGRGQRNAPRSVGATSERRSSRR